LRKYVNGKLVVYLVIHPEPGFTGFSGVDFYGGKGSTSSFEDVVELVRQGCRCEDPSVQAEVEAAIASQRAEEAGGMERR